ncbi:calcium uniporter regulatory subunit MCUb, mitochondrial [Elephas maximus indicus]|uniref:calcium uniporter regulatory subunit MCUb, mitochondrial n=1 Tax=Elephas maximus indicus TaxID=99487 RepID=UPI0021171DD9|nr:calcium uniporter regulatory subunit MCUb, mitochondrial [Elephas maximus indicus]
MMLLRGGPRPWRSWLLQAPATGGRAYPRLPTPQILRVKVCGNLKYYLSPLYSTVVPSDEITVNYRYGLPLITLPLPSRRERCQFVVKPMLSTVGSFLQEIQNEDKGVKTAAIFTADGSKIPASTLMGILLMSDFKLVINKITYDVQCPKQEKLSSEHATEMETMMSLVHRLFTAIHFDEYRKKKENHLLEKIDHLKKQLQPLEQLKARVEGRSEARISRLLWTGLALLSIQGGALAWFTWWVYSWDIMEPVTYFITFANSMVFFAYFLVTRQDYTYSAVSGRQFLHFFYKKSKQEHFDVEQYNRLKDDLDEAKEALKRLRHILYFQLPVEELNDKN